MTEGARKAFHTLLWAIVVLFVINFATGAGNLLFTNGQVHGVRHNSDEIARQNVQLQQVIATLQKQVRADCNWYRDVSGLPVATPPMGGRPSIIVPRLISDSRATWAARDCRGKLPAPDPSFLKWAAFYHLPVN